MDVNTRYINSTRGTFTSEDVPLVELMYLAFTCMPGELPVDEQLNLEIWKAFYKER